MHEETIEGTNGITDERASIASFDMLFALRGRLSRLVLRAFFVEKSDV